MMGMSMKRLSWITVETLPPHLDIVILTGYVVCILAIDVCRRNVTPSSAFVAIPNVQLVFVWDER